MSINISSDKCSGCAACRQACPFGAITLTEGIATVGDGCTLCGSCADVCPSEAITVERQDKAADGLDAYRGIWVWAEQRNGKFAGVVTELLGEGRKLAGKLGEELCAVLFGSGVKSRAAELIGYGADKVYVLDDPELDKYHDELYTYAMHALIGAYRPSIVLMGATTAGRSLAPRLATRLRTGLTADCTELDIDPERKLLLQTRPAFGGNIMATILCQYRRPQMATVRPKVLPKAVYDPARTGQVIEPPVALAGRGLRVKIVETVDTQTDLVNLEEADVVVSGGRGLGDPKNFALVEELARLLGGAVGASRAAVDEGWIPYSHQVGQTGKTISPKVYIACGISGAVQHQIGMRSAETIIAINKNPEAPIFQLAHYGIVGDVKEVLTALIAAIKQS